MIRQVFKSEIDYLKVRQGTPIINYCSDAYLEIILLRELDEKEYKVLVMYSSQNLQIKVS